MRKYDSKSWSAFQHWKKRYEPRLCFRAVILKRKMSDKPVSRFFNNFQSTVSLMDTSVARAQRKLPKKSKLALRSHTTDMVHNKREALLTLKYDAVDVRRTRSQKEECTGTPLHPQDPSSMTGVTLKHLISPPSPFILLGLVFLSSSTLQFTNLYICLSRIYNNFKWTAEPGKLAVEGSQPNVFALWRAERS